MNSMTDQNLFMYSQNRFSTGGMGGGNRFNQNPFEVASSAAHRQFHQMKAQMPSDVLELFKANQIGFVKAPVKPKCRPLDPICNLGINILDKFSMPNSEFMEAQKRQSREQRLQRIAKENKEKNKERIQTQIKTWNPFQDANCNSSDPQKTLFVGRLNYETTQKTLKFGFEKYGIIKSVQIVKDEKGKSRGYGFVEFDNKEDFINAYKQGNNIKLQGKRLIVDYQRGRTTLKWRPRRFGEGLGQTRMTKQELQQLRAKLKEKKRQHQKNHRQTQRQRSRSHSQRHRQNKDKKRNSSKERKSKKDKRDRSQRYR